jgi:hypothetical protein
MNKTILLASFLTCALLSCSKDQNTPSGTNASGSVTYKVNGAQVTMNNVDVLTGQYAIFQKQLAGSVIPKTRYVLNAQNGANNVVVLAVVTDSMKKITYHYDSTALGLGGSNVINYNGQISSPLTKNDYFDITVTDYSNGRVSGTFTAKLTPISSTGTIGTPSSVSVTEGKLNNVQVVY